MSDPDTRRIRYQKDSDYRRSVAQSDARYRIYQVLDNQPDMSEVDPEALGHEFILKAIVEESSHFKHRRELNRGY